MANDPTLVIDDTLVLINLSRNNHRIPARGPNGEIIRRVGGMAAPSDHNVLIVEEGIEELHYQAADVLELPTTLRYLEYLPGDINKYDDKIRPTIVRLWRRLPEHRWKSLCSSAIRCADGTFLFTCDLAALDLRTEGFNPWKADLTQWLPKDAGELIFTTRRILTRKQMAESFPCIGVREHRSGVSPAAAIADLARAGRVVQRHPAAEAAADARLRSTYSVEKEPFSYPCYVITAREPITCPGTGDVLALFTLRLGWWYYASIIPVIWQGQQYFIGCLNELRESGAIPYNRREMAVYSRDGLVPDRKITEAVYEEFLLMSFV